MSITQTTGRLKKSEKKLHQAMTGQCGVVDTTAGNVQTRPDVHSQPKGTHQVVRWAT